MASDLADPRRILDIAFAFRRSRTLLAAVELGLFAALAEEPRKAKPLAEHLGLHGRGAEDFFDALVALGLLVRDTAGRYANTAESGQFLDPRKEEYIGHALHRVSTRVYGNWNSLTSALRTGQPQSGVFGISGYGALYAEPRAQETFLQAMTGSSLTFARALAAAFPWQRYGNVVDIGSAEGCVPVQIARAHPHMIGGGFDLPAVEPWFTRYVRHHGLSQRLQFHAGDFHRDPLPSTEVMVMARVLHNWSLPVKKMLLSKAYEALPAGGAVIICEHLIDHARNTGPDALLASLHMLIETADGAEATGAEYTGWLEDSGFREVRILQLACAQSAIVGEK